MVGLFMVVSFVVLQDDACLGLRLRDVAWVIGFVTYVSV